MECHIDKHDCQLKGCTHQEMPYCTRSINRLTNSLTQLHSGKSQPFEAWFNDRLANLDLNDGTPFTLWWLMIQNLSEIIDVPMPHILKYISSRRTTQPWPALVPPARIELASYP